MPRSTSFSPDEVGRAALELVRAQGWDALTARAVGARLGVSVAPVYGAFASMEELSDWLLEEIDLERFQDQAAGVRVERRCLQERHQ